MSVYIDTGIILKLYVLEANSAEAARQLDELPDPWILTRWQELEAKTALRLKAFRQEISAEELVDALEPFDADVSSEIWERTYPDETEVFRQAETLSSRYASTFGCRSLDIIHVAVALTIGADRFVTFDVRQTALARAVGLSVNLMVN